MVARKSTQLTNLDAVPPVVLKANESGGRARRKYFDYTVPAGNEAVANTISLCRVPKGARLFGGKIAFEAMSTGAGAASIQIGDGTTATKYLGTVSVDAAGVSPFGDTVALFYGEELTSNLELVATVVTEAWLAGQRLRGHIDYVAD